VFALTMTEGRQQRVTVAVGEQPPDSGTVLDCALHYHWRGFCVIPVERGKKSAAVKWRRYQSQRPAETTLKRWFGKGQFYPAVILGSVSGGLVCRDFDKEEAYKDWADACPQLARSLPTVSTSRGKHVYFLSKWRGFIDLGDGELRGDSQHYCLVPPAVHPTGVLYEWLVPLPDAQIPLIDPFPSGLGAAHTVPDVTEENRRKQKAKLGNEGGGLDDETTARIEKAISSTLPSRGGQRNRAIFEFARHLQGIPGLADLHVDTLKPFVRQWHNEALSVIRTKPFGETWIDFLKAWPRVKWPKNEEFMPMILERSQANPLDGYDDPRIGVLAGICRELHKVVDGCFYLATRAAGELLHVSPMTISRWLFLLEHDGLIRTVEKGGTPENPRKASRFVYLGPDGER